MPAKKKKTAARRNSPNPLGAISGPLALKSVTGRAGTFNVNPKGREATLKDRARWRKSFAGNSQR